MSKPEKSLSIYSVCCLFLAAMLLSPAGCSGLSDSRSDADRQKALNRQFGQAWDLIHQGKPEVAIEMLGSLYDRMQKGDPAADDIVFWMGHCYQEMQRWDLAIQKYREVVATYPESAYAVEAQKRLPGLLRQRQDN